VSQKRSKPFSEERADTSDQGRKRPSLAPRVDWRRGSGFFQREGKKRKFAGKEYPSSQIRPQRREKKPQRKEGVNFQFEQTKGIFSLT